MTKTELIAAIRETGRPALADKVERLMAELGAAHAEELQAVLAVAGRVAISHHLEKEELHAKVTELGAQLAAAAPPVAAAETPADPAPPVTTSNPQTEPAPVTPAKE